MNYLSLEVVSDYSDTQLQVGEKGKYHGVLKFNMTLLYIICTFDCNI